MDHRKQVFRLVPRPDRARGWIDVLRWHRSSGSRGGGTWTRTGVEAYCDALHDLAEKADLLRERFPGCEVRLPKTPGGAAARAAPLAQAGDAGGEPARWFVVHPRGWLRPDRVAVVERDPVLGDAELADPRVAGLGERAAEARLKELFPGCRVTHARSLRRGAPAAPEAPDPDARRFKVHLPNACKGVDVSEWVDGAWVDATRGTEELGERRMIAWLRQQHPGCVVVSERVEAWHARRRAARG